ncbi:MAG: virulence RhuM family protein [Propionibacterium sp.]|nr:virulence RhuM family protein [Propionibacterium sp.]
MDDDKLMKHSTTEFLVFIAQDSEAIDVRFDRGTIWLTQQMMSDLFRVDRTNITKHLATIYASGELDETATSEDFSLVRTEGVRRVQRQVRHYNLDAIISVGYRVNSIRATQFRQWATKVLRDFTLRGYVIDRDRMEAGEILGVDHFERLLQEIREIRLSERRFYQKVTDIYATAVDYSPNAPATQRFFATVQNKMHFAVHGRTAAELIHDRADSTKPHMGLTSWKNAPDGKVLRGDVTVGKNYLTKEELQNLGRLVEAYLNLAESRAERRIPTTMEQWTVFLDQVLTLDSRELLQNAGSIAKDVADRYAVEQYQTFRVRQDAEFVSDFDAFTERAEQAIEHRQGDN